jgi:hypothetical protein
VWFSVIHVSSIDELYVDHEGGGSSEKREGDECETEPVLSCIELHTAFETHTSFFYVHNIGLRDEQNILNLEMEVSRET